MSRPNSPSAVLVIDLVNDFVTGVFGNVRAQQVVPRVDALLQRARQAGVPVIFCCDAHLEGVDVELRVHPSHALRGTWGAEIVPELSRAPSDFVVHKRRYSAFFGTDLQALLGELGVSSLLLTGVATNGCVRHTAADGFFHGFGLTVVSDCVEARDEAAQQEGLLAMQRAYGAQVVASADLDLPQSANLSANVW